MRILVVGDIVGSPGRETLKTFLEKKGKEYDLEVQCDEKVK